MIADQTKSGVTLTPNGHVYRQHEERLEAHLRIRVAQGADDITLLPSLVGGAQRYGDMFDRFTIWDVER